MQQNQSPIGPAQPPENRFGRYIDSGYGREYLDLKKPYAKRPPQPTTGLRRTLLLLVAMVVMVMAVASRLTTAMVIDDANATTWSADVATVNTPHPVAWVR